MFLASVQVEKNGTIKKRYLAVAENNNFDFKKKKHATLFNNGLEIAAVFLRKGYAVEELIDGYLISHLPDFQEHVLIEKYEEEAPKEEQCHCTCSRSEAPESDRLVAVMNRINNTGLGLGMCSGTPTEEDLENLENFADMLESMSKVMESGMFNM